MITHFAELQLQTVSIQGVKQVYGERLGLPIVSETEKRIEFQLTKHAKISFEETYEPLSPAHFAIQVPYSKFSEAADFIRHSGLLTAKWENGREIDESNGRLNLYFRDGDGNLLEIIAHNYIEENVLEPEGPFHAIYIREVGLPVDSVPVFRDWLKSRLAMKTSEDEDIFNFVVGGTAHAVVVWKGRPWIPIAMQALPPKLHVKLGTPDRPFLDQVRHILSASGDLTNDTPEEVRFVKEGFSFSLIYTPDFAADIPARLQLPLNR